MEKRDFDKGAESYDLKSQRVKLAQDVAKAIITEVNLTRDMDILDFGCGTGLVTLQLQPYVRTVTGVDSSHGMLDVLRSKIDEQKLNNVKPEFIDIEKGDVLKGRFHLVVSSMTLHHIQDIGYVLKEFYNRLLPGGYLCIADLDSNGSEFHSDKTGVVHFGFDRSDIRQLFIQGGFHDVRDVTAARVIKNLPDGRSREFTVFLMIARK
jgi:ubiquinone/menaquinone biosynthesis C-methylase UbiE